MINPGGTPSMTFDKAATTRFTNNQVTAARASMPLNKAAQASLRKHSSKSKPNGPAVGPQPANVNELPLSGVPQGHPAAPLPTGGPALAPEAAAEFDPAVFQESMLDQIVGSIRTQEFLNSPRVKDAATSVRLKNFFNNTNPQRVADSRNLLDQVISRIGPK